MPLILSLVFINLVMLHNFIWYNILQVETRKPIFLLIVMVHDFSMMCDINWLLPLVTLNVQYCFILLCCIKMLSWLFLHFNKQLDKWRLITCIPKAYANLGGILYYHWNMYEAPFQKLWICHCPKDKSN